MAKWEAQYKELMDSQRGDLDFDYGTALEESWKEGMFDSMQKLDDDGLPILEPYTFGTLRSSFVRGGIRSLRS